MSLDGISNDYKFTKQDAKQTNLGLNDEELSIFENAPVNDKSSDTISPESLDLYKENDLDDSKMQTPSIESDLTQQLTNYLESLVLGYEEQFTTVKENNGIIAKGWDWFKNKTGIGAGSDKVKEQINDLKKQIEELKKDSSKIYDVYKSVTGNELNDEELNNLINGKVDLSNSEIIESVSKYAQGQKQSTNVISGITSGLAVTGLIAAGIVSAPFTGGLSLGASAAAIGTLTAAGTAAYMVPQVIDGMTEKDGYSFEEGIRDVANGVINSTFSAVGMGAGKAVGAALGKTAGKTVAGLAASETTSLIIGDGIGIGNYLTEAVFNDDVDFSWKDLGKTAVVSTASSAVAGAAAFGASSAIRPVLTSGTTAQSQIIGRLISSGLTGGSAGMSAAAVGGGANYLLTCALDGKEATFDEWLNASAENLGTAILSGFIGGVAFEALHLAAGTPKPEGTVKTEKGTNEDGMKYTNYLDKNGNVLATDISASDMAKIYDSANNERGLTQYDAPASLNGKIYDTTRTIRISYTNIPNIQSLGSQDGMEVFTQIPSDNYRADITLHDWADNSYYLGSGMVNGDNITNPNVNNDTITAEFSENTINTSQLNQETPITKESALANAQNDTDVQLVNPNSQNTDMVVDTTLAQFAASQTQIANVQAQAQDAIICANAAAGIASCQTANAQNNSAQISSSIMTTEELESVVLKILEKNEDFEWLSQNRDINKLCKDFSKIIDLACSRLEDFGIKFSQQAVLDIIEAGEYIDPAMYTEFTGLSNHADTGRAYILAQLIKNEIVTYENIEKVTGYKGSLGFNYAYSSTLGQDYFNDILSDAGIDDQTIDMLLDITNGISKNGLSVECFKDCDWENLLSNISFISQKTLINPSDIVKYGMLSLNTDLSNKIMKMSADDIKFYLENYQDSKYYTPEEYLDAFKYFKNLKTPDGKSILGLGEFSDKMTENFFEGLSLEEMNKTLYSNIKELLSVNPASVEASYIQTLLELIESGSINPSAIRVLDNLGSVELFDDSEYDSTNKWTLSENLKKDIDILYDTIAQNTDKTHLQTELAQAYTPAFKNEQNGISSVNIGDTFQVEGEDYIRIKTSDTSSQLMSITKETYYKLFPPIERFTSSQQVLGDCYAIETFMSLYCDPDTRADIVSKFSEDSNGNITVNLSNRSQCVFKNGKMPVEKGKDVYSDGADGFRMLEYTYSVNLVEDKINQVQASLSADKLAEFTEFIEKNGTNIFIYEDNGEYKWTTFDDAVKTKLYSTVGLKSSQEKDHYNSFGEYLLGNGGTQANVLDTLGYNAKTYVDIHIKSYEETKYEQEKQGQEFTKQDYIDSINWLIEQYKNQNSISDDDIAQANGDYIWLMKKAQANELNISIDKVYTTDDFDFNLLKTDKFYKEYTVQLGMGAHAYSLTKTTDSMGQSVYYLFNPHNQGLPIKIYDLDTLLTKQNVIQSIIIAKKGE